MRGVYPQIVQNMWINVFGLYMLYREQFVWICKENEGDKSIGLSKLLAALWMCWMLVFGGYGRNGLYGSCTDSFGGKET
jgi:hypothetical protein